MSLVDEIMVIEAEMVKRAAILKLAKMLYDNIEHDEPRDKVDWITAEEFINRNPDELQAIAKKYSAPVAYEVLEREDVQLRDFLRERERLIILIRNLNEEDKNRHLDLILKEYTLKLYQSIQRSELLIEGCYGVIKRGKI